jgi:hypothetical protein
MRGWLPTTLLPPSQINLDKPTMTNREFKLNEKQRGRTLPTKAVHKRRPAGRTHMQTKYPAAPVVDVA